MESCARATWPAFAPSHAQEPSSLRSLLQWKHTSTRWGPVSQTPVGPAGSSSAPRGMVPPCACVVRLPSWAAARLTVTAAGLARCESAGDSLHLPLPPWAARNPLTVPSPHRTSPGGPEQKLELRRAEGTCSSEFPPEPPSLWGTGPAAHPPLHAPVPRGMELMTPRPADRKAPPFPPKQSRVSAVQLGLGSQLPSGGASHWGWWVLAVIR